MEITARIGAMAHKLHVNLGHPQTDQFIQVLRAAQSKPEILEFVRNHFKCDACEAQHRPPERRRVAMPRTFQFNRTAGRVLKHRVSRANFQVVTLYTGGAKGCWNAFLSSWLRFFGPPGMLCDGGPEFQTEFERG
eukprot:765146-Pyramimonas_sp.AAC.1